MLKACFLCFCVTWDVDVRIVSSRDIGVGSIRPDSTAHFEKKVQELVEGLEIAHCVVVGSHTEGTGFAALVVEYLLDALSKRVGERTNER